jgi:2-methylcitrate dehydratase PrpD
MNLSKQLAEYICETNYAVLPQDVKDMAISCMYNYFGCVYSGVAEPPPQVLLKMLQSYFPPGRCRVLGTDLSADPATAALINGTSANSMGFDDMYKHGIYHPGVPAITAALVIADLEKVGGEEFITSVVLGYEVANRIAKTVNPSHYKYWHTAATVGSFGAAAAASKMLGLSSEQVVSALGVAGTKAAGLQECNGNMAQRLHLGTASSNGVVAALMAKCGFQGPQNILDGPAGFISAMSKYEGDPAAAFRDLGNVYTILDTTFKFYPCCGHIHASIDAAIAAMQVNSLTWREVEKVEIGTYQTAITNSGNPAPKNVLQAKFSIPYCVASGIMHGKVTVEEFKEWPPGSELLDLMSKVRVYVDNVCEANFPKGRRGGLAKIHTQKGIFEEVRYDRKGDPEYPLSEEDVVNKYEELMAMAISSERAKDLGKFIASLPSLPDVSVLTAVFR